MYTTGLFLGHGKMIVSLVSRKIHGVLFLYEVIIMMVKLLGKIFVLSSDMA